MTSRSRRKFKRPESRSDRVRALLDFAADQLKTIAADYESAVGLSQVPLDLSIRVKNYCENLRSALDYLAHQVFEWLHPTKDIPKTLAFPSARQKSKAEAAIERQFPGLKAKSATLWRIVLEFQPYRKENKHLRHFLAVVNDSKHWDLVSQRSLTAPFDSPEAISIGPVAWRSEATGEWVTFRFRGLNENAYWILFVMHQEISELVDSVSWQLRQLRAAE